MSVHAVLYIDPSYTLIRWARTHLHKHARACTHICTLFSLWDKCFCCQPCMLGACPYGLGFFKEGKHWFRLELHVWDEHWTHQPAWIGFSFRTQDVSFAVIACHCHLEVWCRFEMIWAVWCAWGLPHWFEQMLVLFWYWCFIRFGNYSAFMSYLSIVDSPS